MCELIFRSLPEIVEEIIISLSGQKFNIINEQYRPPAKVKTPS